MDTTESILMEICRSLLKEISGSDHIEIVEQELVVSSVEKQTTFVTHANIRWPTCGKTRVESLGWMAAQALAHPGLSEQLTTKVRGLLMQNGITIPTREEYEKAASIVRDRCSQ